MLARYTSSGRINTFVCEQYVSTKRLYIYCTVFAYIFLMKFKTASKMCEGPCILLFLERRTRLFCQSQLAYLIVQYYHKSRFTNWSKFIRLEEKSASSVVEGISNGIDLLVQLVMTLIWTKFIKWWDQFRKKREKNDSDWRFLKSGISWGPWRQMPK